MESSQEQEAVDLEFESTHHCGRASEESISYLGSLWLHCSIQENKIQPDNRGCKRWHPIQQTLDFKS